MIMLSDELLEKLADQYCFLTKQPFGSTLPPFWMWLVWKGYGR